MEPDAPTQPKQTTAEFWKSYFAKFRRPVGDHEASETTAAPLMEEPSGRRSSGETRRARRQKNALALKSQEPLNR